MRGDMLFLAQCLEIVALLVVACSAFVEADLGYTFWGRARWLGGPMRAVLVGCGAVGLSLAAVTMTWQAMGISLVPYVLVSLALRPWLLGILTADALTSDEGSTPQVSPAVLRAAA